MSKELRFDGKVAIITGAGNGLGRTHALLLASRGAKVVVNDLGGGATGGGKSSAAADKVVEEIKAAGGEAVANYDSVEDGAKIVQAAMDTWKRIDIVVNNAGILRDTSFQKLSQEDWDLIYRVHVLGGFRVSHAAWNYMRDQSYGRIIFTASAAGIYGNFGQANYSMAKLGLLGLSNTLAIEGKKKNVFVNTIAPIAGSRLTETVLPKEAIDALKPEYVSPLVAYLCHESCNETGGLFEVGGGLFTKLRWERTEGQLFRPGRAITPESVQSVWSKVVDFSKTTHPTDIMQSMTPIMSNVQAPPSKGGNEFIDVDQALGHTYEGVSSSYDERDLSLYALGVGAAQNAEKELQYVYEMGDGFKALPTFAVVPAVNMVLQLAKEGKQAPGLNFGLDRILHGEQYTEVLQPLPPHAKLTHKAKIKDIFDKGKLAVVVTEIRSYDETGAELMRNEVSMAVRGAGGWGGERGPSNEVAAPDRAPDAVVTEKIPENQALIYRLSGDWNPLHADPSFATAFGFQKPILHGLCTFGYAGRNVITAFAPKGDARFFKAIKVRFADVVFPGETLITEMWKDGDRVHFRCKVKEREKIVVSNAYVDFYKEIPKPVAAAKAQGASAAAAPKSGPASRDVFGVLGAYVAKNADLPGRVGVLYEWRLKNPESVWTLDLKNGKGGVTEGSSGKAECTLEMEDSDFLAMTLEKADAQKMYFGGKLKITGNIMASQKLEFLKKIDPKEFEALLSAPGAASAGPAAAPASSGPTSQDIFGVLGAYIKKNPDLAGRVGVVYEWRLKNPEAVYTMDLKNGGGSVSEGSGGKAECTLEIEDSDFQAMTSGKADAQKLYFGGKLKITGNIMASQKLEFLKKIDPKEFESLLAAAPKKSAPTAATGAPAAAAPAAAGSADPLAPKFVAKVKETFTKNANLAKELGGTIQFVVKNPDAAFSIDKSGKLDTGMAKDRAMTVTLEDADLAALASGGQSPQALHQKGRLRLDGDAHLAKNLGLFKVGTL